MHGFLSTGGVRPDMTRSARPVAVVVALLIVAVIALPTAAAPGDGPRAAMAQLTLDGQSADGFSEPAMDVSTALTVGHHAGTITVDRYAFDERFSAAGSDERKRQLLLDATTRFDRRITALQTESRTLRRSFRNGTIGPDAFVREQVKIGAESARLRASLQRLDTLANQVTGLSYQGRIGRLDAALVGLQGPVRSRALASMRGSADPTRLYVSATADGVVLAMIENDRYVREAYRADKHPPGAADGISLDQAASRIAQLYPDAYNSSIQRGINGLGGGVYRITITLQQGTLTAYLDGSTEAVFFEIQERRLTTIPATERVIRIENGTRLLVDRTVQGGPLRLETVDNETGAPVPSTLRLGDQELQTGEDGVVWTLMPPTERLSITAVRPDGTVSVSIRPLPPEPVNA